MEAYRKQVTSVGRPAEHPPYIQVRNTSGASSDLAEERYQNVLNSPNVEKKYLGPYQVKLLL